MPEYLAPGVYIEETSFRAKSVEGVATSTTGFVGPTAWGPVEGPARLVTSFTEFAQVFGGLETLDTGVNYLAHAARAYFENGGRRLYVARVLGAGSARAVSGSVEGLVITARSPGSAGDRLTVSFSGARGPNARPAEGADASLQGLAVGDLVELSAGRRSARFSATGRAADRPVAANLRRVARGEGQFEGTLVLANLDGTSAVPASDPSLNGQRVQRVDLIVTVSAPGYATSYGGLSLLKDHPRFITTILRDADPPDSRGRVAVALPETYDDAQAGALLDALLARAKGVSLSGGADGALPTLEQLKGYDEDGLPSSGVTARGLQALEEIDDIAIVAAPGNAGLTGDSAAALRDALLAHCERCRYRFAILSADLEVNDTERIRVERSTHDSSYGALYYPWVNVVDPDPQATAPLALPPEGFIAGIYARSDTERGVHKAPANEIVRGARSFNVSISHGTQEVLNPEGINCLRFFEGRGNRVWGARTLSSDPEWKYLNVRRLFIYLEHSIDRSTQWAVFEPNNETLWKKVALTIESFLTDVWRTGALMGASPKEAFFVRCDRTTMTQGDLDNGRMVCLIGVAPTRPAEFVIFRIGQWTAEASIL